MALIPTAPWSDGPARLAASPALAEGGADVLAALAGNPWYALPADEALYHRGDPATAAYVVVAGALDVLDPSRPDAPGEGRVIARVGHGGIVGEVSLLVEGARTTTVRAARDSVLVEVSREQFRRLALAHPEFTLALTSKVARHLVDAQRATGPREAERSGCSVVALAPVDPGADVPRLAEALARALAVHRRVRVLSARDAAEAHGAPALASAPGSEGHAALARWLLDLETSHDALLLRADPGDSEWTRFCVRQAETVLLVGRGDVPPPRNALADLLRAAPRSGVNDRRELALLHPDGASRPRDTARWLDAFPVSAHHHVRLGRAADVARLARRVTGEGFALSLSGGAARGIAHLGVARALGELGVPVDHVSGTSMGSLFGAFLAAERPLEEVLGAARGFVTSWFRDPTLPVLSALSGGRFAGFLREHFGDLDVEDLWRPYVALASSLDRALPVPLARGPVADAVRASASVPGLYAPVARGGELLVDGLFTENLPALRARDAVRGYTVAVNVIPPADPRPWAGLASAPSALRRAWELVRPGAASRVPPVFELVMYCFFLPTVRDARALAERVDCYVEPAVGHVNFLDGWAFDECLALGERAARESVGAWLARAPEAARHAGGA